MARLTLNRLLPAVLVMAAGVFAVYTSYRNGDVVFASGLLVAFVVIGWWSWPTRRGPHLAHAAAQAAVNPEDVIVYWRPG